MFSPTRAESWVGGCVAMETNGDALVEDGFQGWETFKFAMKHQ